MPLNIDWQQILLHLLNFTILAGGLYFLLYKPVKKFMDDRAAHYAGLEQQARDALNAAEEARQEADQARAGLREALRKERDQAMAAVEEDSRRQLDQASREARDILDQARKAAQLQQENAIKESDRAIRELAISAAEKLAGDPYDRFLAQGRSRHGA